MELRVLFHIRSFEIKSRFCLDFVRFNCAPLFQVTIAGPVSDVDVLQTVRATAGRSRAIQNELKTLKAKLYGLEGDLRGIY